jgi:hypothetical protein
MSKVMLVAVLLPLAVVVASAQFTEWSPPVNLGAPINDPAYDDSCLTLSKDGLSLIYSANRPTGVGGADLWVSTRATVNDPWGTPQLVQNVNTAFLDACPGLSPDEHRLYFNSNRPGGCGWVDIWVSRRKNRRVHTGEDGWQAPVNLGCVVNGTSHDAQANVFEDETGTEVLYFNTWRGKDGGGWDIYMSRMGADGAFGPPTPVAELNTPFDDAMGAVRRDGLEIIFPSSRPGGLGDGDLYTAMRASTSDPWSPPVNLAVLNSWAYDGARCQFSFDGRQFYFMSKREFGNKLGDLYVATREKLLGPR